MRRPTLFSTPAAITVGEESLDDRGALGTTGFVLSSGGFEIVPSWQARRSRGRRHMVPVLVLIAVAAAGGLWIRRGDDARALGAHPVTTTASRPAGRQALVVTGTPNPHADPARAGR